MNLGQVLAFGRQLSCRAMSWAASWLVIEALKHLRFASGMLYKFVVHLDASQDESNPRRANQVHPFFLICGINVGSDVSCPVHSGCLGISNIGDVVDMAYGPVSLVREP